MHRRALLHIVEVPEIQPRTYARHVAMAVEPPTWSLAKIPEAPKKNFPAGVMAGDAEPNGKGLSAKHSRVVLWTKYKGKKTQLSVRLRQISPEPLGSGLLPDKTVKVKDRFVHYDAGGLKPGTQYEYTFLEESDDTKWGRSPVGCFWTPIAPNSLKPVVFGGTSCTMQRDPRLKLTNRNLRHAAKTQPDLSFFLHLGDQVYCDAPSDKPATTLKAFRVQYQRAYSKRGLEDLHQAFGMYNTWDDHEVFNGWQGDHDTIGKRKVNKVVRKIAKKNKAKALQIMHWGEQSFYDHQPIRRKNRTPPKKLWRKFRWGRTLELFILDCRSERRLENHHYISIAQEKALKKWLKNSKAVFKFILNSRPIGYFLNTPESGKKKRPDVDYRWTEHWVRKQRTRILKVARKTAGVWWLSGDVHFGTTGWVGPGKPKAGENRVGEVLMGPGGQWVAPVGTDKWERKRTRFIPNLLETDHIAFATIESNYVVIHANPAEKVDDSKLEIRFYGGNKKQSTLLYQETRNYAGEVISAVPTKEELISAAKKKRPPSSSAEETGNKASENANARKDK